MTPADLLAELKKLDVKLTLAGDRLKYEAPAGVLTDDLKEAMRRHKAELVALLQERSRPQVIENVFCFDCFRKYGKAARYQPHTAAPYTWEGDSNWLELTCTKCGAKCYMRDRWGGGEAIG